MIISTVVVIIPCLVLYSADNIWAGAIFYGNHTPKALAIILDEPSAGLDPKERIRIRNFISEIAEDKIVLISTHVVSDIEFIAKEIIVLKNGQLVSHDTCTNLLKQIEINKDELKYFQDNFRVSNLRHNDENIIVRIVADKLPNGYTCTQTAPSLEYLYLYVFEQIN